MSIIDYKLNRDHIIFETEHFLVDVGPYPEEVLDVYRIWNKETGVLEYAHTILFYAKQWADMATNILKGEVSGIPAEADILDLPSLN